MSSTNPMVSICMAAYKHEGFIAKAIESVMMQETDFPIELVIGEDCSPDATREICEHYAAKYPDRINLLPSETNYGMSKNGIRIMNNCRGKYIAILDGDDYWSDPQKLKMQVEFLEKNPAYGLIHSDVVPVDGSGAPIEVESVEYRRQNHKEGNVFFSMLSGFNFINSCTALFRHDLLKTDASSLEKYWFAYDFWYWQRIAMHAKVYYLNKKTACYRMHAGGITNTTQFKKNKLRSYHVLHDVIEEFHKAPPRRLNEAEKRMIFQKIISLLYRKEGTLSMKLSTLKIMPHYFPGISGLTNILLSKLGMREPLKVSSKHSQVS